MPPVLAKHIEPHNHANQMDAPFQMGGWVLSLVGGMVASQCVERMHRKSGAGVWSPLGSVGTDGGLMAATVAVMMRMGKRMAHYQLSSIFAFPSK